MTERRIDTSFPVVNDMLWTASKSGLPPSITLRLLSQDRLGPVMEMAMAMRARPERFTQVRMDGEAVTCVLDALTSGRISGSGFGQNIGVFPLPHAEQTTAYTVAFDQWTHRFQNAAAEAGFLKPFARGLAGALGELVDNVFEHSESDQVALAGFCVANGSVEFVVSDGGVGVLRSLRRNPDHASLADSGKALEAIVYEGASRFPAGSGHGHGVKQLFRALAGCNGHLRFRSGDYELALRGDGALVAGSLSLTKKAELPGLTISILCRLP